MPGSFAEDLDFTATVAAGLQDSGFDPNLVIDNAGYHKRSSPPGSNEPGTYRTPFAETVPDLGIYAVPAIDPVASEQRGFVIGELPKTPADEKDIPLHKPDLYPQRNKSEKKDQEKVVNQKERDRSEIVVIEDDRPPSSSKSVVSDVGSSLSKKEQKRRDKAAKSKILEELAKTASLKTSEPSQAAIADGLEDTSSKKKSAKSKKPVVVHEEGTPPANSRDADGRTSQAISLDDEWDVLQKDKRSRRGSDPPLSSSVPSERAIRGREPKYVDDWDLPEKSKNGQSGTSEVGGPLARRRTMDEFSSFELTEKPEDWDSPKKSKKSKRDSASYDSPSRAMSVTDSVVESSKEISTSFSDLRDLRSSAPDDGRDTSKKSKKKKSKRDTEVYDSPLGSPTTSRSAVPSGGLFESHRHKPKGGSRASSLTRSDIGDDKSERKRRNVKRRNTSGGIPDENEALSEGEPPDRARRKESFQFIDNDVSSVVSDPAGVDDHYSTPTRRRSKHDELLDDTRSINSAPSESGKKDRKERSKSDKDKEVGKEKEKKYSAGSGFFDRFRSFSGIPDEKGRAGVGLAGVAAALASQTTGQKATDIPSEKEAHSSPLTPKRRSISPRGSDLLDPEIVQREIRPAIDPQYGDLLPLPPSAPGTPTPEVTELPALPDSRPETPEHERQLLREIIEKPTHVRRRSAHETPIKLKTPSHSAIPIQFRLGQRASPASPGSRRQQSPHTSPEAPSPEAFTTTPRSRAPRPTSWDNSKQLKPLSLHASGPESHDPVDFWNPRVGHTSFADFEAFMISENAINTPLPPATEDELKAEEATFALRDILEDATNTPLPAEFINELEAVEADFAPRDVLDDAINTALPTTTDDELEVEEAKFTPQDVLDDAINTALPATTDDELDALPELLSPVSKDAINTPLPVSSDDDLGVHPEVLPQGPGDAFNTALPAVTEDELQTKPVTLLRASADALSTTLPAATDDELDTWSKCIPQSLEVAINTPLPTTTDNELHTGSKFSPHTLEVAVNTPLPATADNELHTGSKFSPHTLEVAVNTPLPATADNELDIESKFPLQTLEDAVNTPLPAASGVELNVVPYSFSRVLEDAINKTLPAETIDESSSVPEFIPRDLEDAVNMPLPAASDDELVAEADVLFESHDMPVNALQGSVLPIHANLEKAARPEDSGSPDPGPFDTVPKKGSSYLLHLSPPFAQEEGPSEMDERSPTSGSLEQTPEPAAIAEQSSEAVVTSESAAEALTGAAAGVAVATTLLHGNDDQVGTVQDNVSEKRFNNISAEADEKISEPEDHAQQPEARALLEVSAEPIDSPSKKSMKKKGKNNVLLAPKALLSPVVDDAPPTEDSTAQFRQEKDTIKEDIGINVTSDEISQPPIEAHNGNKDQPARDKSRIITETPPAETETTVTEAQPAAGNQSDDKLAQNANKSLQVGGEAPAIINETQHVGVGPSFTVVQPIIEAQLATEAPSVIGSGRASEPQPAHDDHVPVTPTKKSKRKKKNRKSVILDAELESPAKPEQAELRVEERENIPVLVSEDKFTNLAGFHSQFEISAEDDGSRIESGPVENPMEAHKPEIATPIEDPDANHDGEILSTTKPATDLARNSQHDSQVAPLFDEDRKPDNNTEEPPQNIETQDVPAVHESALRELESQAAVVPAETEPSTRSTSKKSKKKNRKSSMLEPETNKETTASEMQTPIINEPTPAAEETGPAKSIDQDSLTPDFVNASSTPPVDSTQTRLNEQDTLTPELVDAPSSLAVDNPVFDKVEHDSATQAGATEAPTTPDQEATISLPSIDGKALSDKEVELAPIAEATDPTKEDVPEERMSQIIPTGAETPAVSITEITTEPILTVSPQDAATMPEGSNTTEGEAYG
ncbi:uncharacterized protein PG998_001275 [Apiospora kogelbergensis]|uniref:uncharacterized protein n=1 Tax=Apiospora kogelbergensis TaxID=1337665 RepID=UPI00312D32CA